MKRYPVEPLTALLSVTDSIDIARLLGVSGSTAKQYREEGVTARVADRLAVAAGYHPAEVWPEWTDDQMADCASSCAECGEPYFPVRPSIQRFCSRPCYRRHHRRANKRRLRATPEGAEKNRERRRRYYAENREYERARERRRYWTERETRESNVNDNNAADLGFSTASGRRAPSEMSGGHRTVQDMNDDIEGAA